MARNLSTGTWSPQQYQQIPPPYSEVDPQSRIHILGTGNIGSIVAHSLRYLPSPPPVTLLFQNYTKYREFNKAGNAISVFRPSRDVSTVTGFDVEVTNAFNVDGSPAAMSPWPIWNLIVTTKAHHTVAALRPIMGRLTKDSTILILQNGMGVIDEVKSQIFPDPSTRPNFVTGITTHGVYPKGPFSVKQKGFGNVQLGYVPEAPAIEAPLSQSWFNPGEPAQAPKPPPLAELAPTTEYLVSTLLESPDLSAFHISLPELLSVQLEKLAVNAVINPLTVLFDCRNGELLENFYIVQTMRVILWEVSQVICSLPEIAAIPGREVRFSAERLYDVVIQVARATADNWSSMVQDVRKGKQTEIDYINGFVVDKAKEKGLPCTMNLMLVNVVKGKGKIVQQRERNAVPFVEA